MLLESPLIQEVFGDQLRQAAVEAEARGVALGEARGEARSVVKLLRLRFAALPEGLEQQVLGIQDEAVLDQLFSQALACPGVSDFLRSLPSQS